MASTVKNFLFKVSSAQIILSLVVLASFIAVLAIYSFSQVAKPSSPIAVLAILTFLLLLTRLSILVKVGIGFVTIILFPVQLVFGFFPVLAMILITSAIYLYVATKPTPIDFMITKGVQGALAQTVYFPLWALTMVPIIRFLGTTYIVEHLTLVYMVSVLIYIVYMMFALPILAREPVPIALINGMVMIPVQFFLVSYIGPGFVNYLLAFG